MEKIRLIHNANNHYLISTVWGAAEGNSCQFAAHFQTLTRFIVIVSFIKYIFIHLCCKSHLTYKINSFVSRLNVFKFPL